MGVFRSLSFVFGVHRKMRIALLTVYLVRYHSVQSCFSRADWEFEEKDVIVILCIICFVEVARRCEEKPSYTYEPGSYLIISPIRG